MTPSPSMIRNATSGFLRGVLSIEVVNPILTPRGSITPRDTLPRPAEDAHSAPYDEGTEIHPPSEVAEIYGGAQGPSKSIFRSFPGNFLIHEIVETDQLTYPSDRSRSSISSSYPCSDAEIPGRLRRP